MWMRKAIGSTPTIPTTTANARKRLRNMDSRRAWRCWPEVRRGSDSTSFLRGLFARGGSAVRRSEACRHYRQRSKVLLDVMFRLAHTWLRATLLWVVRSIVPTGISIPGNTIFSLGDKHDSH